MGTQFEKLERQTAVTRAGRVLRDAILRGDYAPGDKLPPERDLAATLGITRVTLRSALARLAASGLVATVQGDGHRVLDVRVSGGLDRLPEMALAFEGDPERVVRLARDLLALRRLVMAEAAATCASLGSDALEPLRTHVRAMESAEDEARFSALDLEFGSILLQLAGNIAFQLTYNTMLAFAADHPALMRVLSTDRETLLEGVRSLVSLLTLGDPTLARTAVLTALETLDAQGLARVTAQSRDSKVGDT